MQVRFFLLASILYIIKYTLDKIKAFCFCSWHHAGPWLGQPLVAALSGPPSGETPWGLAGPPRSPRPLRHGGDRGGQRGLYLWETLLGGPSGRERRLVPGRSSLLCQQEGQDLCEHFSGLLGSGYEERTGLPGVHFTTNSTSPSAQTQESGRVRGLRRRTSVFLRRQGYDAHLHFQGRVHREDLAVLLPILLWQGLRHHGDLSHEWKPN